MNDPLGLLIGISWGVVTMASWSVVLVRRYRRWQEWHDGRAKRELIVAFGLWLLALVVAVALLAISIRTVVDVGQTVRGVSIGVAIGCFTGVGVMAALDKP